MLSPKTKGALIRVLASEGHSAIALRAVELGLEGRAVGGNTLDRSMALLRAVQEEFAPEEPEAQLVELADEILQAASPWQLENDEPVRALVRRLEIDGYSHGNGHLVPATPTPYCGLSAGVLRRFFEHPRVSYAA